MGTRISKEGEPEAINWWPMLFSAAIVSFPLGLARRGMARPLDWTLTGFRLAQHPGVSALEWSLATLAVFVFVGLFAFAVVSWQRQRTFLWVVPLLTLLGIAFAPRSYTASMFIDVAAALVPWSVGGSIGRTVTVASLVIVVELFEAWIAPLPALQVWWGLYSPALCVTAVAAGIWVIRAIRSMDRLAKIAERERIARDLHDVVGHTLTLITLKAELAGWALFEKRDPQRARAEMADIESASNKTVSDVMRTIRGDLSETMAAEIECAAATLRTANIAAECRNEVVVIDYATEVTLGLALREAVTNIVRHAGAASCRIRLDQTDRDYSLEVHDNGRGGNQQEGGGLRGMRERVEAVGGTVSRTISGGTHLLVRIPIPEACGRTADQDNRVAKDAQTGRLSWWPMTLATLPIAHTSIALADRGNVSFAEGLLTGLGLAALVALLAAAVASWQMRRPFGWELVPLTALGVAFEPFNPLGLHCFALVAGLIPWTVSGVTRRATALLASLGAVMLAETFFVPSVPREWLGGAILLCLFATISNSWIVSTTLSIRHLARIAERERISRDLQSSLGQIMWTIASRARTVQGLLTHGASPESAGSEVAEIETLSRQALAYLRQTIRGYRGGISEGPHGTVLPSCS
jgi:two-component system, NarL family, sensor histidine kinase DesK